ncbi:sensor histidine kinase [Shewanella dokdonensis]|uniref:histidine kinase n=1 Tax=Shewanella dokdonensis TaxID=712036 RepID=A0ABX8DH32_9GAMM|nr:ATP-binding protein [Shewanella dokdonensis]MCL1074393.1 ATP-binding protein [Shewanella dokdonensis]QVK24064.1 histidine kinase [Shewanella dokdonensis]
MSIEGKLTWVLLLTLSLMAAVTGLLLTWHWPLILALAAGGLAGLLLALYLGRYITRRINCGLQALTTGLLNFQDHDFSVSLTLDGHDEWRELAALFNTATARLRKQRAHIYQRELLLDSVLQNTSLAIVLTDEQRRVLYANLAARHLLAQGSPLEGKRLPELVGDQDEIAKLLQKAKSGVFSINRQQQQQIWHLNCAVMRMNGVQHHLYQFKPLTQELTRAEIQTWKKVIRVISHELNNSLAPISSMAHSGQRLLQTNADPKVLARIFDTISERSAHLNTFLQEYADFARLPLPQCSQFNWPDLLNTLQSLQPFTIVEPLPENPGWGDARQLGQVLLNLLKNAAEAGSAAADILLELRITPHRQWLTVSDRGEGMAAEALSQALLPFYSTKAGGTGLGLALCREIIENHGGQLAISNREDGGLQVRFWLPCVDTEDER